MQVNNKAKFNLRIFLATRQYLAGTLLLAFLSIGLLIGLLIPKINTTLATREKFESEKPKLERLKRKLTEVENISFTPEFKDTKIVEEALPSKKPLLEFLTSLNTISVANNVKIESFGLNPGLIASSSATGNGQGAANTKAKSANGNNAESGTDILMSEMVLIGKFANIQKFLIDIEKISPFTKINTLSIAPKNRSQDFDNDVEIQAFLSTKTYFFTQSVKATVEAPLPKITEKELDVLQELATFSKSDLPPQIDVTGGGLEDLFGVDPYEF